MSITVFGSYKSVLKKYADFSGRLSRKGFWYFVLANFLIALIISIIGYVILPNRGSEAYSSGWTYLLILIPLVGPIILLVYYFRKGDQMENTYGPVPTE